MIIPTVGRVVLFRPRDTDCEDDKRNAAIIAQINEDGSLNLAVFNDYGVSQAEQYVKLVQDDDEPGYGEAEWMLYQKGQVGKNVLEERIEQLEKIVLNQKYAEGLEIYNNLPGGDDLDEEHENDNVVTDADLVESPDGTDEAADDNLSEDDITGDGSEAEEKESMVEESVGETEEAKQVNVA